MKEFLAIKNGGFPEKLKKIFFPRKKLKTFCECHIHDTRLLKCTENRNYFRNFLILISLIFTCFPILRKNSFFSILPIFSEMKTEILILNFFY